jgi:hypothetical protein
LISTRSGSVFAPKGRAYLETERMLRLFNFDSIAKELLLERGQNDAVSTRHNLFIRRRLGVNDTGSASLIGD